MNNLREFSQSPADRLDYGFLYADWLLDSDTIASSSWAVPSPLISSSPTINATPIVRCGRTYPADTATSVFVTGGVLGSRYLISNTIITAQGRTYTRRIALRITEPQL